MAINMDCKTAMIPRGKFVELLDENVPVSISSSAICLEEEFAKRMDMRNQRF